MTISNNDENGKFPQREDINEVLNNYKKVMFNNNEEKISAAQNKFQDAITRETDPDLITSYEIVELPSKGLFYPDGLKEVKVEYMTSKDEDILTSISLIEKGEVINELLRRKVKTPGVNVNNLLIGDRSAIILFLRTSSYGPNYDVNVTHPKTGNPFKATVDLTKLKYKEITKLPDEKGEFEVEIPMRKKVVKFRLLTYNEIHKLELKAEKIQEEYGEEYSRFNSMKLKAHVTSINGNTDRSYIDKFIDAMPALDSFTIRKEILEVEPNVNMNYTFETADGYKFNSALSIGIDFFFPSI